MAQRQAETAKRRGRPPKHACPDVKSELIRTGLVYLTERGYMAADIDSVLKAAGIAKGSFYHCFANKEDFGRQVIAAYADYFNRKLDVFLQDVSLTPLARIAAFCENARQGMEKYGFTRGCLIGSVAQEATILPESYHSLLNGIFETWQDKFAACLKEAQAAGELPPAADCRSLACFFWLGWEGAVMRAKLTRSGEAMDIFARCFLQSLNHKEPHHV